MHKSIMPESSFNKKRAPSDKPAGVLSSLCILDAPPCEGSFPPAKGPTAILSAAGKENGASVLSSAILSSPHLQNAPS